ncbi:MobC family plasmid mobilization relaxosome protein [Skermania sp. ID1734]|uniref:plasmid mobilization relaxosome protein MobC n=1 Tax=Skermania sp. ID1734 TaxID=2597516 RepID=UPI00117EDF40|nr:plasmid mobilization relaxosome protein MobC [Skermania sp. ID1734]TSD94842.1 MobC family plasmid mobilization relaxosome protein [Skermania sp. ID1734]
MKLTDQEEQLLRMRATAERVSVQRLLLACTLDPEWRADDEESVAPRTSRRDEAIAALAAAGELRNLLAAIGNNINQIAAHVNATDDLAEDVVPALDAARRACDAVTTRMRAVAVPRGAAAR